MITNGAVRALTAQLEQGAISEKEYALRLKRLYEAAGESFDQDTLNFVESKFEKFGIPFAKQGATDGVIKQAVSGLLEGFTTFGFADTPDTGTEKIVNNIAHLIGLAPGIMAGGLRMITGATKTVGQSLINRGIREGNKKIVSAGERLKKQSKSFQTKNKKLNIVMARFADKLSKTDVDDKLVIGLRGKRQVAFDPIKQKKLYELKSIPGKIAEVVQDQGIAFLGENKQAAMNFVTKTLLRNKMGEEAVGRILQEAGHVGLLMAFSNHPWATRVEGEFGSGERIKQMAMAGMHGSLAGGIFGGIAQYGNIAKLMTSTNPGVRKAGEDIIRKTAAGLARKKDDVEVYNFINTVVKGTLGAGYGAGYSAWNDLPVEEQIYETLMGVFFSVNGRAAFENRATRDINSHQMLLDRDLDMNKARKFIKQQDWYINETKEYQWYWDNYIESIQRQQLETIQDIRKDTELHYKRAIKRGLDEKLITEEQINQILSEKGKEEGMQEVIKEIEDAQRLRDDPNYEPLGDNEYRNSKNYINLGPVTDVETHKVNSRSGNDIDFPINPIESIAIKTIKQYPDIDMERFHLRMKDIVNKVEKDYPDKDGADPNRFVEAVINEFPAVKFNKKTDIPLLKQTLRSFQEFQPKKNSFTISLQGSKNKSHKEEVVSKPYPTPNVDVSGNPISTMTSGRRENFTGFRRMGIETHDYLEVNVPVTKKGADGREITYMEARLVAPAAMRTRWSTKQQDIITEPYITKEQMLGHEKNLNKKRKFIYGIVSDSGRLDVRKFPWSDVNGQKNYLSDKQVEAIYNKIINAHKRTLNPEELKEFNKKMKEGVNKDSMLNTVATYIYRLRDMNLIKNDSDIKGGKLEELVPRWLKTEGSFEGFGNPSKAQKYLNQMDKTEVPFFSGEKYNLTKDDINVVLIKDWSPSEKYESATDGTIILHSSIFDVNIDKNGGHEGAGTAKGTLYSNPIKYGNKRRGLVIGKYAYVRGDKSEDAYMDKHPDKPRAIMFESGAKQAIGVPRNRVVIPEKLSEMDRKDYQAYPEDAKTFQVNLKDFHWNMGIYEKMQNDGTVNIMQQMFLNINDVQFDPDTPVGKAFHDGWRMLINNNVAGDSVMTAKAEKLYKSGKGLRIQGGKNRGKLLDIDKINMDLIDKIMTEGVNSKAAKDIMQWIFYRAKDIESIDIERSISEKITSKHIGELLANIGFDYTGLMSRGVTPYVQKALRDYAMVRIVRPKVDSSYHSILGPYDWKVSGRKQKYSRAERGLANDEFMLWEGAENMMQVPDPSNPKKKISLGEWWTTMKGVIDWTKEFEYPYDVIIKDPGQQQLKLEARDIDPKIKKMSAVELNNWRDSQWAILNRSPVLTSGNIRALKFVGFVRGKNGTGSMIVTNELNDFYMGGADKDIDSAHVSWGMPKAIKDGYKQPHVFREFLNPKTGEEFNLKSKTINEDYAGAEYRKSLPIETVLLNEKLDAGITATYGKDSIGTIFNQFTKMKNALNHHYFVNKDYYSKKITDPKKLMMNEYIGLLRINASIANIYIDAADVSYLHSANKTIKAVKKVLLDRMSERGPLEMSLKPKEKTNFEKTFDNYHKALFRGVLPEKNAEGELANYKDLSNEMLKQLGGSNLIYKTMAEHVRNWNLTIDPFANINKFNIQKNMRVLADRIEKDPLGQLIGIKDWTYIFNPEKTTKQEQANIDNVPHFLYNHMHVIRVAKAIQESNKFVDEIVSHSGNNGVLKRSQLYEFIADLVHTTQYQKKGYYKPNLPTTVDPNMLSYTEQVVLGKKALIDQLKHYLTDEAALLKRGDLQASDKFVEEVSRRVGKLYEYWHEAHPFIELDYRRVAHMAKEEGIELTDPEARDFKSRKQEYESLRNRIDKLQTYPNANRKKGARSSKEQLDIDMWDPVDARKYRAMMHQLGQYAYEARNFQEKGPNNMARNGAISSEVKMDIAKAEKTIIEALSQEGLTEKSAPAKMYNRIPYFKMSTPVPETMGKKATNQIEFDGKFIKESLIDWDTLTKAKNMSKQLGLEIRDLEKELSKYGMTSDVLQGELERFEKNIYYMLKRGNIAGAMDVSSQYTETFKRLDIVARASTEEGIDWNHLRVLNNMLENRYIMTYKEWAVRKATHKKLLKEWKDLGLDPDYQMLPPDFATDLLFPTELDKVMIKFDTHHSVTRAQVVETVKTKDGKIEKRLTEKAVRVPASTIMLIGESIGVKHEAGNALGKALEQEWNGLLDLVRTTNPKEFVKYQDTLSKVAIMERQLGIKGNEKPDGKTGPRPNEHYRSIENLERNLVESRKELEAIPDDVVFRVIDRSTGEPVDYSPRQMVEFIKSDIFTPFSTEVYHSMYRSNYKAVENILTPRIIRKGKFGGIFNYDKFYDLPTYRVIEETTKKGKTVKRRVPIEPMKEDHPEYWKKSLSESLLTEHGWIDRKRVRFIDSYNVNNKQLQSGKNVVKEHFHIDDINWINFQLDILDIIERDYGVVKKDGFVGLDIKALKKSGDYNKIQKLIKESNEKLSADIETGKIGMVEVDGKLISERYVPLRGQDSTKDGVKRIAEEHIPQETIRIFGSVIDKETGKIYYNYDDIPVSKRGKVEPKHTPKFAISKEEIGLENQRIHLEVERGMISLPAARQRLYNNMIQKLVHSPERFNNDFFNEAVEFALNNLSSRVSSLEKPGTGTPVHGRTRPAVPVEGYDTTFDTFKNYANSTARGITGQLAALSSRMYISEFKNGIQGNKHIQKDVGERWLLKIVDSVKGYMGYPSTRSFELNGVSAKEMGMLKRWAKDHFSDDFATKNGLGSVEVKLLKDYDLWTKPSENEVRQMQSELLESSGYNKAERELSKQEAKIDKKKFKDHKNRPLSAELAAKKKVSMKQRLRNNLSRKQKEVRDQLYGRIIKKSGEEVKYEDIMYIDYNNSTITQKGGKAVKVIIEPGLIRKKELEYKKDFLNDKNIDKMNMRKSFRSFYSDETIGNVMMRIDNVANKALGYLTGNRIQIFKDLPTDPSARHKAMVSKLHWLSDIEGKFEMMSLLAHPKSSIANLYGGTINSITDTGLEHYMKAFNEDALVNNYFRGKKYRRWNPIERKWEEKTIKKMEDIHLYFESYGFLENNITTELAMMRPSGETSWQNFAKDVGKRLEKRFKELPVYGNEAKINEANAKKRTDYTSKTMYEAAIAHGVSTQMVKLGSLAMSTTERHLRVKSAIAHYVKAKDMFRDSRGKVEVSEEFLLEFAKKGIAASQFIYHATNRPGFSNTAFGRMMTRFHPYGWNSIRRRADIIQDYMLTEGYGNFEANKRFERQMSNDLMVTTLSLVFAASLFEYALSPPMNWMVDFSHLMFGDDRERERAFYNQYGHPALAPLQIVTPPGARFVLQPIVSTVNGDWEAFWKYTAATAFPFGRLGRDVVRTIDAPEMLGEFMFGVPLHQLGRYQRKIEGNAGENREDDE